MTSEDSSSQKNNRWDCDNIDNPQGTTTNDDKHEDYALFISECAKNVASADGELAQLIEACPKFSVETRVAVLALVRRA